MSRADEIWDNSATTGDCAVQMLHYARELEQRVATIEREALERAAKAAEQYARESKDYTVKGAALFVMDAIRALIPAEPNVRDAGPTELRGRVTRRDGAGQ